MGRRAQKIADEIRDLAAQFVNEASNRSSLITVTRADVASNLKRARVYFSVLPESAEQEAGEFLSRRKKEFREFVTEHSSMRVVPMITFELDRGEKNRQRLDELTRKNKGHVDKW